MFDLLCRGNLQGAVASGHLLPVTFTPQVYVADAVVQRQTGGAAQPQVSQNNSSTTFSSSRKSSADSFAQPNVQGAVGGAPSTR